MCSENPKMFETWDVSSHNNSTSKLYSLEPIGIGTPLVESFSGYLARLAEAHNIKLETMLQKIFKPVMKKYNKSTRVFYSKSFKLNSDDHSAQLAVQFAEVLTKRKDLKLLTTLKWAEFFSSEIFREHKAWCPFCYEEQRDELKPVYEPLIWSFNIITVCTRHKQPLINKCPYCEQYLPVLSDWLGYCSKCKAWLGKSIDNFYNINLEKQIGIAEIFGELLAYTKDIKDYEALKIKFELIMDMFQNKSLTTLLDCSKSVFYDERLELFLECFYELFYKKNKDNF